MLVYGLVIFIELLLGYVYKKTGFKKKYFVILSFFNLFIPSALRWYTVGVDTHSYTFWFTYYGTHTIKDIIGGYFEPLYGLINHLLYHISTSWRTIVIFNAFVITLLFLKAFYDSSQNCYLSIMIYILLLFYTTGMNEIRQFFSMALIIYGYKFIVERKKWKYFMVVIIAGMIHTSALFTIVLYFLYNIKFEKKRIIFIPLVLGGVYKGYYYTIGLLSQFSVFQRYNLYFENAEGSGGRTFFASLCLLLFVLVCVALFQKNTMLEYTENRSCISDAQEFNVLFWALVLSTMSYMLATKIYYFVRIGELFGMYNTLLIPMVIERISSNNNKLVLSLIMYIYLFGYFISAASITSLQGTIPFTFTGR